MMPALQLLSGRLLARNVVWNLLGAGVPLLVALWAIPRLIDEMGTERFGILCLIWAGIGYFSLFDFGIGSALAVLASERLGRGHESDLPLLLSLGLQMLLLLGLLAGLLAALAGPWFITGVQKVPIELKSEAVTSIWILSASLPFVTLSSGLLGILRAQQKFDKINLVRIHLGIANFFLPVFALKWTPSLIVMTSVLALSRVAAWFALRHFCLMNLSRKKLHYVYRRGGLRKIVSFGGWLTVSNIIGPLMVYFDRFVIGAAIGMTAVAYYTTPYEVVTRFWIIPDAILGVVFTALSTAFAADIGRAQLIYTYATRTLLATISVPLVLVVLYAREGLMFWLGPDFAAKSGVVVHWLAIGVFVNCFARLPFASLQVSGRPDLTAKLHLLELPFYIVLLWVLTKTYGIAGAAAAWTIRIAVDAVLLFLLSRQIVSSIGAPQENAFVTATLGGLILAMLCAIDTMFLKVIVTGFVVLLITYFVLRERRLIQDGAIVRAQKDHES